MLAHPEKQRETRSSAPLSEDAVLVFPTPLYCISLALVPALEKKEFFSYSPWYPRFCLSYSCFFENNPIHKFETNEPQHPQDTGTI
jgi:hypothetical protein